MFWASIRWLLSLKRLQLLKKNFIPTTSAGFTSHLLEAAHEIIVEINNAQPKILFGIHDVFIPKPPPDTEPIPLTNCRDRIGSTYIPIDFSKIKYIVETDIPEGGFQQTTYPLESRKTAENLLSFLQKEFQTKSDGIIPPIQLGFGNIADAVVDLLQSSEFTNLEFFCGGILENVLKLLQSGKVKTISTGGIPMSVEVKTLENVPDVRRKFILRNGDIMNNAEIIGRLGIIALTTGIETDIYGNVNSSHIGGNNVVNGIGGGANFAQNAGLSVVLIPSMSKCGAISNIVPMVSHFDICEHDIDVVISENGYADIRGLDDVERAEAIISNCAADEYKRQLRDYLQASKKLGGHHPQNPQMAFTWYTRLKRNGGDA